MPLVQQTVQPVFLCRSGLFDQQTGLCRVKTDELQAVTNLTLSNVLRQLADLVAIADGIFQELAKDLRGIHDRSLALRAAVDKVQVIVDQQDATAVTVPEGDICSFSLRTKHYKSSHPISTALFAKSTRPQTIQILYNKAIPTPVPTIREFDQFRRDGNRGSKFFLCTPVLTGRRKRWRKVDLDIETRKPSSVIELRKWTSTEALGDITVQPDNTVQIEPKDQSVEDAVDHLLPSPEEQMMAVALRFPPSIVAVDVTGQPFARLSTTRRSLTNITSSKDEADRRRRRKRRDKRRNTIAGTSPREIEQAVQTDVEPMAFEPLAPLRTHSGGELFKLRTSPRDNLKQHLNTIRQWSKTKLKAIKGQSNSTDFGRPSFKSFNSSDDLEVVNLYEKVKLRSNAKSLHRHLPATEAAHSSSGNWSASSESGRTSSIASASETTPHPRSTSSCQSLQAPSSGQSRRKVMVHAEGGGGLEWGESEGEEGSVYSCDTEGYYTSFHMDSGLKTLKEEDLGLSLSSLTLDATLTSPTYPTIFPTKKPTTAESEYELFGKGSTSTTTSSAGTVCTTLLNPNSTHNSLPPPPPERKSSLERKRPPMQLTNLQTGPNSPDSGHNTSSSPGDLEAEVFESIREKTEMRSERIPSMCVITPPVSDDEVRTSPKGVLLETDLDREATQRELVAIGSLERRRAGARVTLDCDGKVVYSSDSLKRKKEMKSFEPGANKVESPVAVEHRIVRAVRPIQSPKLIVRPTPKALEKEPPNDKWMSQHPAVSSSGFPRSHPMYWTLSSLPKSSTPTNSPRNTSNLTLSPISSPKSTMTSEELFAAIHKSKKKLQNLDMPKKEIAVSPSSKTSLQHFKMLLLQKGLPDKGKVSAVEQLERSKGIIQNLTSSPQRLGRKSWKIDSIPEEERDAPVPQSLRFTPRENSKSTIGSPLKSPNLVKMLQQDGESKYSAFTRRNSSLRAQSLYGSFINRHFQHSSPVKGQIANGFVANESPNPTSPSSFKNVSLETAL